MTDQDKHVTRMIFRIWDSTGEVIAIMPEVPSDALGHYPLSYMRVGQHGGCNSCPHGTRPATAGESAPLRSELESLGYRVAVCGRETRKMRTVRMATARATTREENTT